MKKKIRIRVLMGIIYPRWDTTCFPKYDLNLSFVSTCSPKYDLLLSVVSLS
ncbi:hypothetical protein Hdeb2414_s0002g00066291 [Helianthus debilis subsp. tardiflorus]